MRSSVISEYGFVAKRCKDGLGNECYNVSQSPFEMNGILVGCFDGHVKESTVDMLVRVAEWAYRIGRESVNK